MFENRIGLSPKGARPNSKVSTMLPVGKEADIHIQSGHVAHSLIDLFNQGVIQRINPPPVGNTKHYRRSVSFKMLPKIGGILQEITSQSPRFRLLDRLVAIAGLFAQSKMEDLLRCTPPFSIRHCQ